VHTNALIHEASPYLLQHAHNPVDWLPWGDAAFEKARLENKPVFLSVGYAACHWCHVMEHESFKSEEIAEFLNAHFVAIKVDREERPDVDHHYMLAVQKMTGSGGWPMSVFLTPDRKPFYAGTYWAPEARYGRPGFMDVLKGLANAWETERDSLVLSAAQLHDAIHEEHVLAPAQSKLSPALLDFAVRESERNFDSAYGGFSRAPKFPHAMELAMLLRYYSRTGNDTVKHMVEFTLDNMARGGIFDQIGGGFHRYSTDDKWLVPHFEKMLYDNALLMQVYADAAKLLGRTDFARVSDDCHKWVNRDLSLRESGYASSLDADSEGEEGKYYVWAAEEWRTILTGETRDDWIAFYGVTDSGNFENGLNIPFRPFTRDSWTPKYTSVLSDGDDPTVGYDTLIPSGRDKILAARMLRIPPARDDKALCDWNGLMITALVRQGDIYQAKQTATIFLSPFNNDSELVHSFLGEKELRVQLLLDYAAFGNGLLDLFCATGDLHWFNNAYKLADEIERRFATGDGLYYMSEDSVAGVRSVDLYDSALPSGNSLAGNLFVKLYYLTGEVKFRDRAEKQVNALMPYLERMPTVFSQALLTAEWLLYPPEQVVIVWPQPVFGDTKYSGLIAPNRQVINIWGNVIENLPNDHPLLPLLSGKATADHTTTYYLCRNFTCELPTTEIEQLRTSLKKPWQK